MRLALRFLPVYAFLACAAACTATRTVKAADLTPSNLPTRVWVTRADHTTVVLESARLSGDTLIGVVNGQPQRLPLSAVARLRVREPSEARTVALMFAGYGGLAVLLSAQFAHEKPQTPVCPTPSCSLSQGDCLC